MSRSLTPRVALVTGAGRGIGRAVAVHLAACGMRVAVAARTRSQIDETVLAITDRGDEALGAVVDVLDVDAVRDEVTRIQECWGRLDLLVNNAGSLTSIGPLWESEPETWAGDLAVNTLGVYHGCRAVIPGMIAAGSGRIINLVGGGTGGPFPHASAYATSKAAVMRLTENLAAELDLAGAPVRVFAITPGLVRTEMTEQFLVTEAGRRWMSFSADHLRRGEDVSPDLAARLVAAIASGDLDEYHGRLLSAPRDVGDLQALEEAGKKLDPSSDLRRLRIGEE